MHKITTEQDHEDRLRRLELLYEELDSRLKYHSENHYPTPSASPRMIFCCEWIREIPKIPKSWKYCPNCGGSICYA